MDPCKILGVDPSATREQIREAWLECVRRHPPDRDPVKFQEARDAYQILEDPVRREAARLFGREDVRSLEDLAGILAEKKRWLGPAPWNRFIREMTR